ncbi:MAG: M42 family metallopeptidase [Clostridia bacterium]|nr:M42 family metallopeptidase [Clostridia bacterium]
MKELEQWIQDMTLIPALSGYENKMADYLTKEIQPFTNSVEIDPIGNVIARIDGREKNSPKVMIFAHMDQLGLVVRKIDDNGFIQFERLGGVPEKVLPGLKVQVKTEDDEYIPGVIGNKSHHITPPNEKTQVIPYLDLYIDLGANSKEEVQSLGIDVGCPIIYEPSFQKLANNKVAGTSIDNRGGCACLLSIAKALKNNQTDATVYLVGTVLEEYNLRGAMIAARKISPDLAICIDVCPSGDTPDTKDRSDIRLGRGPIISMYSFHGRGTLNGTIPHPKLVKHITDTAKQAGINIQKSALTGILTDLSYVQLELGSIPSIDLAFAARYTHSPVEVCDLEDIASLCNLLSQFINQINSSINLKRWE